MVSGHLQVKSGRYYAVINYKDSDNKRKVKWIALGLPEKGNKLRAEEMLLKLRSEFKPPVTIDDLSGYMLFTDYLLQWVEIAKSRIALATYSSYKNMIDRTIVPYFKPKNLILREVQAKHLQRFYSEQLERVKPNTVIRYHSVIHTALQYAFKTDLVVQNVASKVDRPRKNDFEPVFLSAEEMQKMLNALHGHRLELPVLVAAFYGLRREEVLGLRWDAIDFKRETISIKHTVTCVNLNGKDMDIAKNSAKSKSSLRTLPLVGQFKKYFQQVKEMQEYNKKICGNSYNYEFDGYVFVDEMGNRMSPRYLSTAFPQFLVSHGLKKMRFHDLRHSCASLLLANGISLKHIQDWLGHSDFATTANIYAHLDYSSKLLSAQTLENGLNLPQANIARSAWYDIEKNP